MSRISDMHKRWMRDRGYREAYTALENEFLLASATIELRNRIGLTQEALARKMGTTQPVIARLESGRGLPSMRTLERLADAAGSRLVISFARSPRASVHLFTAQRVEPHRTGWWGRYRTGPVQPVSGTQLTAA